MKKLLLFLALAAALLTVSSCKKTSIVSVDASAVLIYPDLTQVTIPAQRFDGFSSSYLSDDDLEYIFTRLIRNASPNFSTAALSLDIYDAVTDVFIRKESYGVVYNSYTGHYDFAY